MHLSKKIPSLIEKIHAYITEMIDSIKLEFVLSEDDVFHLRLALDEALTNAIRHGHTLNPNLPVEVTVSSEGNQLIISIKDKGPGFNFDDVPDPTQEEKIMKTSGRGIFLIKQLMDKVEFSDGGRCIQMVKNLPRKK